MTEDTIGVRAIWDGDQMISAIQKYIHWITVANQVTAVNTKGIAENLKRMELSMIQMGYKTIDAIKETSAQTVQALQGMDKAVETTAKKTAAATKSIQGSQRGWIRSISFIMASLRLLPQVVQDFTTALKDAAAGKVIKEVFSGMAEASGVAADQLIANMQRASRGTIKEVDLIRVANRALMVGGAEFAAEVPRLIEIARAAALASGRDMIWVFDTLTQGIARSSAKLIDNAEIYLRLGPLVEDYAKAHGVSADELDAETRQTIILNGVLKQGADLVKLVGAETDTMADRFNRAEARLDDFNQKMLEFLNNVIPATPAIHALVQEFNKFAPALQTLALFGIAGVFTGAIAAIKAFGGALLGLASGAAAPFIVVTLAITRLFFWVERLFEKLGLIPVDALKKFAVIVGYGAIQLVKGRSAADDWLKAVTDIADVTNDARDAMEKYLDTLDDGDYAYYLYAKRVKEVNDNLKEGELAVQLMTKAQFKLNQQWKDAFTDLDRLARLIAPTYEKMQEIGEGLLYTPLVEDLGVEPVPKAAGEELQKATRERMMETEKDWLDKYQDIWQDTGEEIKDIQAKLNEDLEKSETKHADKMADLEDKAAADRAKAYRDYWRDIRDAEIGRQRDIEDAARKHKMKLEDIEYNYRRRILEINEEYDRTVYEAAIARDALAIIRARRRKQEELTDAARDRQDQIRNENRSFKENLYNIERNYQDRLAKLKLALQDELAEIELRLKEQTQKEKEEYDKQTQNLKDQLEEQLRLLEKEHAEAEKQLQRHIRNMNTIRATASGALHWNYVPGTGGYEGDEGFNGVVQGPTTFKVGPGVREYIYASGDLNKGGGQKVMPSRAANQAYSMRTMVGGAINVGMSGWSNSLMNRIGPMLTESIGQAVVDELAVAFGG